MVGVQQLERMEERRKERVSERKSPPGFPPRMALGFNLSMASFDICVEVPL